MSKTSKYWVWSFAIAILFIAVHGYQFNCSDQEEHLPQVYKLHDASLYKGDYVVESLLNEFSIRFFYVRVVYFSSLLIPVSIVCFVLHIVLVSMAAYFIMRLADVFLNSSVAAVASAMLALLVLNNFTVGGNNIEDTLLTCTSFANAGCLGAWYFYFKKNYSTAFAMAGAASLFQVLMGMHVFMLMAALLLLFEKEKKVPKLILSMGVYLLFASPMLIPIVYRQFFITSSANNDLFYYVLYVFRNPHHYIPSFFPINDYLKTLALIGVALGTTFILKPKFNKEIYAAVALIIAGMILYYLVLEQFGFLFIGKLQWFKTCTWLTVSCCIACCTWIKHLSFLNKLLNNAVFTKASGFLAIFILLLILNSKYLPIEKLKYRYQVGNYPKTDLTIMHEWISANTSKEALFVSFPNDDSFLCEAKRPLAVAYKAVIHEPWFMIKWYIDFLNIYKIKDNTVWEMKHVMDNATTSYNGINNNDYLKHKGVKYRIDDMSKNRYINSTGKPVFKKGKYLLTMLP